MILYFGISNIIALKEYKKINEKPKFEHNSLPPPPPPPPQKKERESTINSAQIRAELEVPSAKLECLGTNHRFIGIMPR